MDISEEEEGKGQPCYLPCQEAPFFPWGPSQHGLALSNQCPVVASTSPQAFLGVTSCLE